VNQSTKQKDIAVDAEGLELFKEANAEYDAGRFQAAIDLFDKVIESGMRSEIVYNNKGTSLDALGRSQEAIECYRTAVSINPAYELGWHNLGNCLYLQDLFWEAAGAYRKAARLNPDRKENLSGLAASYSRVGRRKNASKAIGRLAKFAEKDSSIILLQADLYLDAGLPDLALERCEEYIRLCPDDVQGYARLGGAAHELGEYNRAIHAFGRALKLAPLDKEIWNNLGYTCFSRGYLERAHECFDKALSIDPNYKHAWYNKGYAYHGADLLEEAVRCYKRAIAIDPIDKVLWNNIGNALYNLGRYVESIPKFINALRVDPDYEIAWNNIGNALEKLGAYAEAIPYHDRSLEISPGFDYALYAKGVCKSKIGQLEEGFDLIIESLDLNPSYDEAWMAKSKVAAQLGRFDESLMAIEQSLLLDPEFDQGWAERGELLLATGSREEAQASFEMALKCLEVVNPMTTSGLMSMMRRGDVLARLGRFEDALMNYETVAITRKLDFASLPKVLSMMRVLGKVELSPALAQAFGSTRSLSVRADYAEFLLDAGDTKSAETIIRSIEGSSQGSEELYTRARSRALSGDEDGAVALLSSGGHVTSSAAAKRFEAELLESRGDLAEAGRLYKERLRANPSDFSAAVSVARVELRLKHFKTAIRSADVAIGIDESDWEPHKVKSEAYIALGEQEKGRAEAAQAAARLAVAGMSPVDVEPKVAA
jgi:tetratricopeptide (TPR) repeat protein